MTSLEAPVSITLALFSGGLSKCDSNVDSEPPGFPFISWCAAIPEPVTVIRTAPARVSLGLCNQSHLTERTQRLVGGAAILPKNAVLGEEGWISRLLHHLRVSLPSPLAPVLVHLELWTRRTWCWVCRSGPLPGEIPYPFLPAASAPLTTDTEVITHSKTSTSVGIFLLYGILENLCCLIQ